MTEEERTHLLLSIIEQIESAINYEMNSYDRVDTGYVLGLQKAKTIVEELKD